MIFVVRQLVCSAVVYGGSSINSMLWCAAKSSDVWKYNIAIVSYKNQTIEWVVRQQNINNNRKGEERAQKQYPSSEWTLFANFSLINWYLHYHIDHFYHKKIRMKSLVALICRGREIETISMQILSTLKLKQSTSIERKTQAREKCFYEAPPTTTMLMAILCVSNKNFIRMQLTYINLLREKQNWRNCWLYTFVIKLLIADCVSWHFHLEKFDNAIIFCVNAFYLMALTLSFVDDISKMFEIGWYLVVVMIIIAFQIFHLIFSKQKVFITFYPDNLCRFTSPHQSWVYAKTKDQQFTRFE